MLILDRGGVRRGTRAVVAGSPTPAGGRARGPIETQETARPAGATGGTGGSARFLVALMLAAVRAELLDLEPVGIVAAVLLGDVVAVLADLAGQGDLGAHIC